MGRVAFVPEIKTGDGFEWSWTRNKTKLARQFRDYETVDYIQLQWNRKFHETGDFSLHMRAQDYDSRARLVLAEERPEVGIIQKIEYNSDITGDFVTLSGFFADKIMDFTILPGDYHFEFPPGWPLIEEQADSEDLDIFKHFTWKLTGRDNAYRLIWFLKVCQRAMPDLWRRWHELDNTGAVTDDTLERNARYARTYQWGVGYVPGDTVAKAFLERKSLRSISEAGAKMGEALYNALTTEGVGLAPEIKLYNARFETKLVFYGGRDLTKKVVFSRENGNTGYIKYAYDWSNAARRVAIYTPVAKYEELQTLKDPKDPTNTAQSNHKYYWDTDCRIKHPQTSMFLHVQTALVSNKYFSSPAINGWPKLYPEAYVNPQIENIDSKGVDAICRESDAAAKLELLNHMPETNVEIGALQVDGCKYLEHYDLGDTVTVRIDAIKEQFTQRIIEVNEVWENNQETPTLVFGNKRRVKYRSPQDTKYAKNRTQ